TPSTSCSSSRPTSTPPASSCAAWWTGRGRRPAAEMRQTLEDFYRAVRAAGVPVPPSGSIAASQAAALVGYGERAVLKYALSMNLANSLAEQALVEECFDQFFRMEAFGEPPPDDGAANDADAADSAAQPPTEPR